VELTGLTKALGQIFIERRQKLPDQRLYRKETKEREHKIADAMLERIRHEEELARLRNLETFVATLAAEAKEPLTPALRENLRELAEQRAALLDKAITTTGAYVRALGNLDHASGQLLKTVAGYDDYLAERLLLGVQCAADRSGHLGGPAYGHRLVLFADQLVTGSSSVDPCGSRLALGVVVDPGGCCSCGGRWLCAKVSWRPPEADTGVISDSSCGRSA